MGPIPNGITKQNKGNKCSFFFIIKCNVALAKNGILLSALHQEREMKAKEPGP